MTMDQLAASDPAVGPLLPADEFLKSVVDELLELHGELQRLMREVDLVHEPHDDTGHEAITLRPTARQRLASAAVLQSYRSWFERVRPFFDRSPTAPTDAFDEAFAHLSTYFALRRVGSGITDEIWRELFELESTQVMAHQLTLLEQTRECFALLNPHPPKRLEDLVIRFAPVGSRRYLVFGESRRGDAQGEMTLPFEQRDVENFILRYCEPLRGPVRGWAPPSVTPYAEFGGTLFDALFNGPLRDLYMQHAAAMVTDRAGLRIRMRVATVPELAALPWEYMYDGTEFLALTGAVTITRHIDSSRPVRPLLVDGPLRIVVTVSAPTDRAPLDANTEVDGLRAALAPLVAAGLVRIDVAPTGTIDTLAAMLRAADRGGHPFHVWHFIGHGRHMEDQGATYLTFEDANGAPRMQSGFELGTLLSAHPALRLAVLNACEGARGDPEDSLTSVGGALVSRGLPAAVSMQFPITDAAAIRFADEFYRALADGGSIDGAVSDGRRSIFFMPNESEWATPVIMLRAGDGALFDVQRSRQRRAAG
jgi:CHAT domain